MQDGLVARVAERLEGLHLLVARVGQQVQRLVGMGGDDDAVEAIDQPSDVADLDAVGPPGDVGDASRRGARPGAVAARRST